jgi:hypothetical protein
MSVFTKMVEAEAKLKEVRMECGEELATQLRELYPNEFPNVGDEFEVSTKYSCTFKSKRWHHAVISNLSHVVIDENGRDAHLSFDAKYPNRTREDYARGVKANLFSAESVTPEEIEKRFFKVCFSIKFKKGKPYVKGSYFA